MPEVVEDIRIAKKDLSQDFRDEFVKSLQGKDFILYGGLITLGHAQGIKGIHTRLVQAPSKDNDGMAIVHAVVIDKDGGEWHGIGDADDSNCNKKVASHKIRMAETRAKGRALRDALGIDIVMDSELTDPYEKEMITQAQTKQIKRIMNDKGLTKTEVSQIAFDEFGVKTAARLLKEQAAIFISILELYEEEEGEEADADEEEEEMPLPKKDTRFDDDDEEDEYEDD